MDSARLAGADAREVIGWALRRFPVERRVVVTGLQAEGVAMADLAIAQDPAVRVLTIDTGRLPEATHEYMEVLRKHWRRDLEVIHPDRSEVDELTHKHGVDTFYTSPELRIQCCHVRKVAPLERALTGVDCWMSGLRRNQSARRATTATIERDERHKGIVKVNPMVAWSDDDVTAYMRDHQVPLHPLYAAGYRSIGCAPCTRPVATGEDPRAGRWWWEEGVEKECGIHASPQPAAMRVASATGREVLRRRPALGTSGMSS
jgi:phosphoadenosine phosphosulfate reductase